MANKAVLTVTEDILSKLCHSAEPCEPTQDSPQAPSNSANLPIMSTLPVGKSVALYGFGRTIMNGNGKQRDGIVIIPDDNRPEVLTPGNIQDALERDILRLRHVIAALADKIRRQESSLEQILGFFEAGFCGATERHIEEVKRLLSRIRGALEYDGRDEIPSICPFCNQTVSKRIKGGQR